MKLAYFLIGLLLLPVCLAATWTLMDLAQAAQPEGASIVPPALSALAIGFVTWVLLYLVVPRPVRTYILAHELTHALWGALMGARVSKLKVSSHKGYVVLSKTNVLITLAPYFFPLYTVLVVVAYYLLSVFFDVAPYALIWLWLIGLTWGFHFTFTITTLLQHQSDIHLYGRLFSYATIYLLNVLGIGLWMVMVSAAGLEQFAAYSRHNALAVARMSVSGAQRLAAGIRR